MSSYTGACTKAATAAVEALHTGDVCSAARALSNKATREDILEHVNSLTSHEVEAIAKTLHDKVKWALRAVVGDESVKQEAHQSPAGAATYLKSATVVLKVVLDSTKADVPPGVTAVVFELHDSLLGICEPLAVQDAIAKLLIEYWHLDAPRAMEVVVQLGPYLLWRAVEGKAADVKRLHAVREAFLNLDLRQAASQDTVDMILAACITPTFLRCAEGRRTLAFFFELNADLAHRLLVTMTGQIGVGKPSIMDAYGEILFKAWQNRTEQSAEHVEGCIQQLMQHAIMAQSTQMSINMRRVLSYLHEQRRIQGVGALLHRLYEPILWCHLKAAHFQVRMNALGILLDAFPIQDSTGNVEIEEGLNMQLTHVMKALRDPSAEVRATAAWGACELLTTWWELLPGQAISRIMVLLQDTAFDGASTKVRIALLEGLTVLVENPLAQISMALLLPNLRPVMFDTNTNVRVRMASLMMRVSKIKALEWWTIVPVPELLYVMGNDCEMVAKIIQEMLFSQYIDEDSSDSLLGCARLLQLLRDNSSAGVAFCKFLSQQAVSGLAGSISPQLLQNWSCDLARHLIHCKIEKAKHAKPAEQDRLSADERENDHAVKDTHSKKSGSRAKRARANVQGGVTTLEGLESPDEWTGLVAGLRELLVPLHEHLQQARSSENEPPDNAKHDTGKRKGKKKMAAATQSPADVLAEDELTKLLEKAPTLQAAQIVLSIGCAMPASRASHKVCQWCLDNFKGGYLYLPGINKPGQRSLQILIRTIPRQGKLSSSHLRNCAVMCQAVDLVLRCMPEQFLSLLGDSLVDTESQELPDGKRRRGRSKLTEPGPPSLLASGGLALTAIATRDVTVQRLVAAAPNNRQYLDHLSEMISQYIARLAQPESIGSDANGFLHDVLLVANSMYMLSAVLCESGLHNGDTLCSAVQSHAKRVRAAVTDHIQGIVHQAIPLSEVVKVCSTLITNAQVMLDDNASSERSKNHAKKRGKAASMDASLSCPQAALLRIACDATHDLAVAANAAVDVVDDLTADVDVSNGTDDAVHASANAADACQAVWQSLQQLLSLHAQLVMLSSGQEIELQSLLRVGEDVALCSNLSVQAIFRGMGMFHVPGDVAFLFAELGKSLALLHSTCGKWRPGNKAYKAQTHVEDLAAAVLTGCVYIEPDQDVADEGMPTVQTPIRSHEEAEEVMGKLIKPSILLVADQLVQVNHTAGDHNRKAEFPLLWIHNAAAKMDSHVAKAVSTNIANQLQKWGDLGSFRKTDGEYELLRCGSQAALSSLLDSADVQLQA